MAIYDQIKEILQAEADIYNLDERRKKKAELFVQKDQTQVMAMTPMENDVSTISACAVCRPKQS